KSVIASRRRRHTRSKRDWSSDVCSSELAETQENMNKFVGEIVQVPPIYSAVKVNGKHLYEYAREGIEVERPQRRVEVKQYDLTRSEERRVRKEGSYVKVQVALIARE